MYTTWGYRAGGPYGLSAALHHPTLSEPHVVLDSPMYGGNVPRWLVHVFISTADPRGGTR
jgi:hypothetical protein